MPGSKQKHRCPMLRYALSTRTRPFYRKTRPSMVCLRFVCPIHSQWKKHPLCAKHISITFERSLGNNNLYPRIAQDLPARTTTQNNSTKRTHFKISWKWSLSTMKDIKVKDILPRLLRRKNQQKHPRIDSRPPCPHHNTKQPREHILMTNDVWQPVRPKLFCQDFFRTKIKESSKDLILDLPTHTTTQNNSTKRTHFQVFLKWSLSTMKDIKVKDILPRLFRHKNQQKHPRIDSRPPCPHHNTKQPKEHTLKTNDPWQPMRSKKFYPDLFHRKIKESSKEWILDLPARTTTQSNQENTL